MVTPTDNPAKTNPTIVLFLGLDVGLFFGNLEIATRLTIARIIAIIASIGINKEIGLTKLPTKEITPSMIHIIEIVLAFFSFSFVLLTIFRL